MGQAIETKYLGPTNTRGARVKAACDGGTVTIPWSSELNIDENHRKAAVALAFKMGWDRGKWAMGWLGDRAVFVRTWP